MVRQGQLCKIKVRNNADSKLRGLLGNEENWFVKLKNEGNNPLFYSVIPNASSRYTIEPCLVDESMRNEEPQKPLYVICAVSEDIQLQVMNLAPGTDEYVVKKKIEEKLNALAVERASLNKKLEEHRRKEKELLDSFFEIGRKEKEIRTIYDMQRPYFLYAYGKHSENGREFVWRIPHELYKSVHVGSNVVAETRFGAEKVVVTRIEELPFLLDHKLVLSVT